MLKIVNFKMRHLFTFHPRELDEDLNLEAMMKVISEDGLNTPFTMLDHEYKPIAIMAFHSQRSKNSEVWLIPGIEINGVKLEFTKLLKRAIEEVGFDMLDNHRLEMAIPIGKEWAGQWARVLGFEREGIAIKYGHEGIDHVIYSRTKKWE